MIGKYIFRVRGNLILLKKFAYDPSKFRLEQTLTWGRTVDASYETGMMKPADAAAIFMMVQVNLLSPEARYNSPFVEHVFNVISDLRPEMTPRGQDEVLLALKDFSAGSERFSARFAATERQFAKLAEAAVARSPGR